MDSHTDAPQPDFNVNLKTQYQEESATNSAGRVVASEGGMRRHKKPVNIDVGVIFFTLGYLVNI